MFKVRFRVNLDCTKLEGHLMPRPPGYWDLSKRSFHLGYALDAQATQPSNLLTETDARLCMRHKRYEKDGHWTLGGVVLSGIW